MCSYARDTTVPRSARFAPITPFDRRRRPPTGRPRWGASDETEHGARVHPRESGSAHGDLPSCPRRRPPHGPAGLARVLRGRPLDDPRVACRRSGKQSGAELPVPVPARQAATADADRVAVGQVGAAAQPRHVWRQPGLCGPAAPNGKPVGRHTAAKAARPAAFLAHDACAAEMGGPLRPSAHPTRKIPPRALKQERRAQLWHASEDFVPAYLSGEAASTP